MVDAARQMLDELMGRNRNLHPSEAGQAVNWEDSEFCQFYNVKFCPHDLFINTRADLGPCTRIHDEEAKHLYEEARPSQRKRHTEDEFLRFCNVMLHDVDRKIQKGKQRLQLMQRDHPPAPVQQLTKHQEQVSNLNARINKLLAEAEEAGIRGDVDQAQDLMTVCEELKEEKETLQQQYEAQLKQYQKTRTAPPPTIPTPTLTPTNAAESPSGEQALSSPTANRSDTSANDNIEANDAGEDYSTSTKPIAIGTEAEAASASPTGSINATSDDSKADPKIDPKTGANWTHEVLPEKQMKVCEICGAFLIVGDAQQRIEDHLMGKQHLGYSKLRNAVTEINERRQKEHEEEERRRRDDRVQRFNNTYDNRRDQRSEYRERSRDYAPSRQSSDRRHHHHKSSHHGHSYSRSGSHSTSSSRSRHNHYRHESRERHCRSRSRSRY